jgi:phosphonate metabolism protein PhnN/1,5-bisphosphokinase (PRPP-forming)
VAPSASAANSGTLVLVVGPSGAGKDALISYCRSRLAGGDVVFARRAITRTAGDGSEDHDTIPEEEFRRRADAGDFSLSWRAHGLGYGVPASIEDDLAAGRKVVVNVSRSIIEEARRRYRRLTIVSVTASPEILARRLRGRGRETQDDIARRLERAASVDVAGPDVIRLDNSGPLEEAGEILLRVLVRTTG